MNKDVFEIDSLYTIFTGHSCEFYLTSMTYTVKFI